MAPVPRITLFLSCLLFSTVLCQTDICYEKADILFVIDSSGSIGQENFQKQLQFLATFINDFQVGITQFSVLRFDSTPSIIFDFDDYKDNSAVKNAILQISYPALGTNTADALKQVREEAFSSSRGARSVVPRIVIVSTDGFSNNPNDTALEAARLKASNVFVLSIGIGFSYDKKELETIATFPQDVFEVSDYNQLVSIVYRYSELVCRTVKRFTCNNKADVYFLLDSSSKILQSQYQKELEFVSNFSTRFDLIDISIGASTFGGSTVQKLFNLGQFIDQFHLSQVLLTGIYLGGVTDTDNALKAVTSQNLFDPASGGRAEAAKILIILTDGGSTSAAQAKLTAAQLRATGVNILAVAVSNPNLAELKDLVSYPALDVVTNLVNYRVAADRVETLTATRECLLPQIPVTDVSNICRDLIWENGIHPHPYDCTKFIECTYLRTDVMLCPPDQVYDPAIKTCNYPGFVKVSCLEGNTPNRTAPPIVVTSPATTAKPCINGTLDILLILDSSASVGSPGFRDVLNIAANLAENFHIGANGILFAAASYATTTQNLFNFDTYTEYKPLQQAILSTIFQGGITNTHLALDNAVNFFSTGHGSRPAAPNVAVLFSSGRSSDSQKTLQEATALKNAGVHIISIGFSNPNMQELQAVASTPTEAFLSSNFNGIVDSLKTYSKTTCGSGLICHGIQFADVIFVLDSSASIAQNDYTSQLTFVADVISKFTLGPDDVRFGALVFSTDLQKLFDLKDFNSTDALQSAILSAPHLNTGTDTAKALNFVMEDKMFSSSSGARDNATKILVLLTDGRSNSLTATVTAAQKLKATGVKFIVVGIGNEIYVDELTDLANDNQSLFLVSEFDVLHQIQDSVTRRVCDYPKEPQNVPDYSYLCAQYRWSDGKHPNPLDCSTYVECYAFTATVRSCYTGEAYDPVTQSCRDKSVAHPCNDPLYFGPSATLPPNIVQTTKGPTIVDITSLCKNFNLPDGIYPDPGSCEYFVDCTDFTTQHQRCPEGLHFNTAIDVCDDVHVVDCQVNYNFFNKG